MAKGSCLCGAVRITVDAPLPGPDACHCTQCRKFSGHYFASTDVPKDALTIEGEDYITWFQSSAKVRRGFCRVCGSNLFWDPIFQDNIGIAMGVFDGPTDTSLSMHIFVDDKGDYYELAEGIPPPDR